MESNNTKKPERRYDIDWLRVLATFGVVFFHVMRFFDVDPWEVKNNATTEIIMPFIGFFVQWMMPIFFVISGAAIFYALGFRKPRQFIKARINRILIPFLTVGVFVLVPPQEYIRVVKGGLEPELAGKSLLEVYPLYIANITPFSSHFPFIHFPAMHLWYLEYLFVFSIILLPLFIYLRNNSDTAINSKITGLTSSGWSIYLFAVPVGLLMSILNPETPVGNIYWFGGWPLLAYPLFLVSGFILFTDKRYGATIKRQAKSALILAIVSFAIVGFFWMKFAEGGLVFGTPAYAGFVMLRALNAWFFIVGFLGLGRKYLSYTSPFLRYFSEASLPIYMLHQTVIVIIGFFIKDWQIGILPKFVFLLTATCIGILGTYEVLIRRFNVVRFLFGLKPKIG